MTEAKKSIFKVISLMLIAAISTVLLSSLALAARDDRIYPSNISVGGTTIANLTRQQALESLGGGVQSSWDNVLRLKVNSTGEIISMSLKDSGINYDIDATLQELERIIDGNSLGADTLWRHAIIRGKGIDVKPVLRLDDKDLLYSKLQEIKDRLDRPAKDARVLYKDGYLEYVTHENGSVMDIATTIQEINEALAQGSLGPVTVMGTDLSPKIKVEDIKTVKDLIGVYISPLDQNPSVSKNINEIVSLLNGTVIMPGDTFSLVKELGNKIEKNTAFYRIADAICQTCLEAHIEIVDPTPKGAAFKDINFTNNLSNPILLYLGIEDNKLVVKIFGCQTEAGREISLSREQTALTPEVIVKVSSELKPQERIVKQEGENGTKIRTYRIVKENGQQVSKELLTEETYPPVNTIILTGAGSIFK